MDYFDKKDLESSILTVLFSVEEQDIRLLQNVIKKYPETINNIDESGNTALVNAIFRNSPEMCAIILKCDQLDVNQIGVGKWPALMWAIYAQERYKCCKLLLKHESINVHLKDYRKYSAIGISIARNNSICLKMIIKYGHIKTYKQLENQYNNVIQFDYNNVEQETIDIVKSWRSYLPQWTPQMHKRYPIEFHHIVFHTLCVFVRLNSTVDARISKDMRLLLIQYIANTWQMEKEKLKNEIYIQK